VEEWKSRLDDKTKGTANQEFDVAAADVIAVKLLSA
jgi:hypothetical protein